MLNQVLVFAENLFHLVKHVVLGIEPDF